MTCDNVLHVFAILSYLYLFSHLRCQINTGQKNEISAVKATH